MREIHSDKICRRARSDDARIQSQGTRTTPRSIVEQKRTRRTHLFSDQHAAALIAHPSGVFGPAQLFDRIEPRIAICADGERNSVCEQFGVGRNAITEIAFRRWADTDSAAMLSQQREFACIGVRCVYDSCEGTERIEACEQLDRGTAIRGPTLLDLRHLLIGMYMQWQIMLMTICSDSPEPALRHGAYRMRRNTDMRTRRTQRLDALKIQLNRPVAEATLLLLARLLKAVMSRTTRIPTSRPARSTASAIALGLA